MIPTIEDIVDGLLKGTITREQATGWLHSHAEAHWPDETRAYVAAMAMQGIVQGTYMPRRVGGEAEDAVEYADKLLAALAKPQLREGDSK